VNEYKNTTLKITLTELQEFKLDMAFDLFDEIMQQMGTEKIYSKNRNRNIMACYFGEIKNESKDD